MSEEFLKEVIYKKDRYDFLGINLELVKVSTGNPPTGYYASCRGNCSVIKSIGLSEIRSIKENKSHEFFTVIEDLHNCVETDLKRDLSCIDLYRKSGDYFKRNTLASEEENERWIKK